MKCFYDKNQEAIGTCKGCGKGLSSDFAIDLGKGLACKGKCEEYVLGIIKLEENAITATDTSQTLIKESGPSGYASFTFFFCLGIIFLVFGYSKGFDILNVGFGLLGIGYSLFILSRAKRISKTINN